MTRHLRPASLLVLASLCLSVLLSCDMMLSTDPVGGVEDSDALIHGTAQHLDDVCADGCADSCTDSCTDACTTPTDADHASSVEGGCCGAEGGDDCALPCWYCGCAHSFSTAVTGAAPSPIPLLQQGSVPETVAATLATDRPRLIHPPSIA